MVIRSSDVVMLLVYLAHTNRWRVTRRHSSAGPVNFSPARSRRSPLALGDLVRELRGDLEQVTHDAEVGDLEDRGLRVLVHGDDRLAGLHPGSVLDGTG